MSVGQLKMGMAYRFLDWAELLKLLTQCSVLSVPSKASEVPQMVS